MIDSPTYPVAESVVAYRERLHAALRERAKRNGLGEFCRGLSDAERREIGSSGSSKEEFWGAARERDAARHPLGPGSVVCFQIDDGEERYTLADMVADNAEDPELVEAIRKLAPGETYRHGIGGGWTQITAHRSGEESDADPCESCGGRGWFVSQRSGSDLDPVDGIYAVERCDECSGSKSGAKLSDEDAARLATQAGIRCKPDYPCYVLCACGQSATEEKDGTYCCTLFAKFGVHVRSAS